MLTIADRPLLHPHSLPALVSILLSMIVYVDYSLLRLRCGLNVAILEFPAIVAVS